MKRILALSLGLLLLAGCTDLEIEESKGSDTDAVEVVEKVEPIIEPVAIVTPVAPFTNTQIILSQDELDYLEIVKKASKNYDLQMSDVKVLLGTYDDSVQWHSDLELRFKVIGIMSNLLYEMKETNVIPVKMEKIHDNLMKCFYTMALAGQKITEGSTGGINEALINEGGALINESNAYLDEVISDVQSLSVESNVN